MNDNAICWINGNLMPASQASISVFDHGFLYGDGIFEGLRFYHRKVFRLPLHLQRLQRSAAALMLDLPMDAESLTAAINELVAASPLDHGYLRIIITRGTGHLGIDPANCSNPQVIMIADELQMIDESQRASGIRAIIASTRRQTPDRLDPRIKSLNYMNSILARMEANLAGVDEAILLNDRGCIAEGTADNLFIVREGRLLTPAATEGALAGITRQTILELAAAEGIPASETVLTAYDLYTAEECFITGTGARLIPVREVDGRHIRQCPGQTFRRLEAAFDRLIALETR